MVFQGTMHPNTPARLNILVAMKIPWGMSMTPSSCEPCTVHNPRWLMISRIILNAFDYWELLVSPLERRIPF